MLLSVTPQCYYSMLQLLNCVTLCYTMLYLTVLLSVRLLNCVTLCYTMLYLTVLLSVRLLNCVTLEHSHTCCSPYIVKHIR